MNVNSPDIRPSAHRSTVSTAGDEESARQLLAQAGAILQGRGTGAPPDFVSELFSGASFEDLLQYEAAELAAVAGEYLALPRRAQARHCQHSM